MVGEGISTQRVTLSMSERQAQMCLAKTRLFTFYKVRPRQFGPRQIQHEGSFAIDINCRRPWRC
jgi:hypothetical protein